MSSVNEAGVRRWFTLSASVVALTIAQGPAFAQGVEAQSGQAQQAEEPQSKEKPSQKKQSKEKQSEEKPTVSDKKPVSPSATANLVNLLLEQGVITQEQADKVNSQVDDEAFVTRQAVQDATTKADSAAKAATAAASAASPPGSRRVSYVPEVVKRQLREDIRKEVMSQAKEERWASPGTYPEWASRIRFHGDLRGRYEGLLYPSSGYNSGQLWDFNAINTGSPFDVLKMPNAQPPYVNGNADRERYRLRARLEMEADLSEGFTAGMRLATGSNSSPVSTNQTLGGSGGNFSRYQFWLDRAYLTYNFNTMGTPFDRYGISTDVALSAGRFDNPFWKPTDLVWDDDVGFDGAAFQTKSKIRPGFTVFAAGGAFPIFNTNLDFATDDTQKFKSADKYLFGGQVGMNWQATPTLALTMGASIYDFSGVQGKTSSPCALYLGYTACDTDQLRPSFAQKGNTYMALRNIIQLPGGPYSDPQYFGLASEFRPLVLSGRADFGNFHPVHVVVDGEFVWNSAFDRAEIAGNAENNRGPNVGGKPGPFDGGNLGWIAKVTVGQKNLEKFGDWNTHIGYRYLESDAVMDAFADSDFGLGGTNLQGYFLGGNFAVSKNVWTTAKWMSANSIAGDPYAVDVLQVDLNAKF